MTAKHIATLRKLQEAMCFSTVLRPLDPKPSALIPTNLFKDASAAVIEQLEKEQTHSVSSLSRTLNA